MKINNLKVRVSALLLAATMTVSLTGCKQKVVSTSFHDLLTIEEVKDVTLMDELLENGELGTLTGLSITDAADQLETYMDVVELLSKQEFNGVEELRPLEEQEYEKTTKLSIEEIKELIAQANSKETDLKSMEDKLIAIKKLDYLNTYCKNWINTYGSSIALDIMMTAAKTSVADELEISPENYSKVVIPPHYNAGDGPQSLNMKVGDKSYEVPTSFKELWNTIQYIYTLQSTNIDPSLQYETYRKAIGYAKTTLIAGSNIKNKKLEAQYDNSYIKQHYATK